MTNMHVPNNNIVDTVEESPNTDHKFVEVDYDQKHNSFIIQLLSVPKLALFDFVELDIRFDPISDEISSDCYKFLPFEDYINNTKNNNSMYRAKEDVAKVLSGVSTAAIMSGIAAKFDPADLPRLESQLALITGFVGGTLIWPWVEARIMNLTADHKLKFNERSYHYERKKSTYDDKNDNYAQLKRYQMANLKPAEMGVVINSKNQRIKFRFTKKQFLESLGNEKINILKIKLGKGQLKEFYEKGVHVGVTLKLCEKAKYIPFVNTKIELMQTLQLVNDGIRIGCLPDNTTKSDISVQKDPFLDGYLEVHETLSFGRATYYNQVDTQPYTIIQYANSQVNKIGQLSSQLELFS